MTKSFNDWGKGTIGDVNLLLFDLLPLLLNQRLSIGVLCEELDYCWQTEDSWDVSMTELFNGVGTGITGNDNSFFFDWKLLLFNSTVITRIHSLTTLIVPWFTFVANNNTIGPCHDKYNMILWWNCVPIILFVNSNQNMFEFQYQELNWLQFFSQYNPNKALKNDLSEKAIILRYIYLPLKINK